ncbi:MAG: hypothetical protein ACE145_17560 [Terriglobia bacterium]
MVKGLISSNRTSRSLFGPACLFAFAALLVLASRASGQGVARDALSCFPADTQQMTYVNLAQLRALPDYPQIRRRVLILQLRDFQDYLREMGTDPDRDIDEVAMGWRGEGSSAFFGRAEGRFDLDRIRSYFIDRRLTVQQYGGHELYSFGTGEGPADVFFTFLSPNSAAFGHKRELKELLDVRTGARPALDSNAAFVAWEAELEGTSAHWGIATGKAAANQAGPWINAGAKQALDPSVVFAPVRAVLYHIDWGSNITTYLTMVCQTPETASAFAALLGLWRDQRPASSPLPPTLANLVQGMEIQSNGSRVELTASGPLEAVEQIMRGGLSGAKP